MRRLWNLLPIATLAVAGVLLSVQQQELDQLKRESEELAEWVAATEGLEARRPAGRRDGANPIIWDELVDTISAANRGNTADMRVMMEMDRRMRAMDCEELSAGLEELQGIDRPEDAHRALESMLVMSLMHKDPALLLENFYDRLRWARSGLSWQLSQGFRQWLDDDPRAALRWFDGQIADGTFDSPSLDWRSESRLHFETALWPSLLESDPVAISARLAELPEDQWVEVIRNGKIQDLEPGTERALVELIRGHVPKDEQEKILNQFGVETTAEAGP